MLKSLKYLVLACFLSSLLCGLSSCVFEGLPLCDYGETKVNFVLKLNIDEDLYEYKTLDSINFLTRSDSSEWTMKYWVGIYQDDNPEPFTYIPTTSTTLFLSLFPGKYTFVAWAEPVSDPQGETFYFHTDDFSEMLQKHKYSYKGNDKFKSPYRGLLDNKVSEQTETLYLNLKPAFARLMLYATDTDSISFNPDKIKVTYYNVPGAIHALSGEINLKWNDVYFNSYADQDLLAFDHILSNDYMETQVLLKVEIYNENNKVRSRVDNLEVPLINGGITTVKGNFYSLLVPEDEPVDDGGGGVKIDPEWEATIEIEY